MVAAAGLALVALGAWLALAYGFLWMYRDEEARR